MAEFDPNKLYNLDKIQEEQQFNERSELPTKFNYNELETAIQTDINAANKKEQSLQNFLETISMIESSGGKNFNHRKLESGIHKGHSAAGTYGLMPNTINEIINRKIAADQGQDLKPLLKESPDMLKSKVESNPELEYRLARALGERVIERQGGDVEKAAYSWKYGHNLTPDDIIKRKYEEDPYVQKYRNYSKIKNMLGSNENE